jgi:alpha-tubulin suppressor-like RCC1 family protein
MKKQMKTLTKFIYPVFAALVLTWFALLSTSQAAEYAWGANFGQLGDGTTATRLSPVAVDMSGALLGKTVIAVAGGGNHSVALTSDGKVFAWGVNIWGQLGDGTTTSRLSPVAVDMSGALLGKTVTAIAAGAAHTVALTSDGNVFAWGYNGDGEVGDGTTTTRLSPVAVDMSGALLGKTVIAVAAGGYHIVALTSDGELFAWGFNAYGEVGDGTATSRLSPVAVDTSGALLGKTVIAVAAGAYHSVVLTSDGELFAWGHNGGGELGDGTGTTRYTAVPVDMSGALLGKTVTAIAAGVAHTVALTSDGKPFAWGFNVLGQLGDGTTTNRYTPVAVDTSGVLLGKIVTAMSSGGDFSVALTSDGKVFAWGYNFVGEVGDGTTTTRLSPVAVDMSGALLGKTVTAIAAGYYHTVALVPTSSYSAPTITVTDADDNPVPCGGVKTVSNNGQCGAVTVPLTITASGNCPGTITVASTRSDGQLVTAPYPVGSTTVTSTATDTCGNTTTCVFTVTVTNNRTIISNFNGTPIPGNSYLWFNAVLKPSGLNGTNGPVTVRFIDQTITSGNFNLNPPDTTVIFDPNAICASAVVTNTGQWIITAPKSGLSGNTFLSGLSYQVPAAGLPGGINPVSWSGTFTTDTAGVSLNWQWAAAVYTTFNANNGVLGVKATDDNQHDCTYHNSDHAGTPEQYKSSVVGGARGGGGSNYTGGLSGTESISPCDTF